LKDGLTILQVGWWSITQTKWHDYPDKSSAIGNENYFISMLKGNHYLIITQKTIQKRINFMACYCVKHYFGKWKTRIKVIFSSVEFVTINANL
jgi:hypothetical protein